MTNKEIDNISYLEALKTLQQNKVKDLHLIVQQGAAAVKAAARKILRDARSKS
jgi:hypothetical protein